MKYQLLSNAFSNEDIKEGKKVLSSKKITMSTYTSKFEKKFAKYVGANYALMVNSGSSANLLAVSALCNPLRKKNLKRGDEVLIPSLCWSTSLWPLVQYGLKIKFVDINKDNLNICLKDLEKKVTKKTKALMLVHVLGLSTDMDKLRFICKKYKLLMIEDTCESLGTKFKNFFLGTFGQFGTYSFYYSHQITSGEGGMIVCDNYQDYKILYSLRSHGWSRGLENKNKKKNFFKKNFEFINSGYNLRPLDISAAIGINQLKRLRSFMSIRNYNREKIIITLEKSKYWKNQLRFIEFDSTTTRPSWFGLPMIINDDFVSQKKKYIEYLESNGIETRPIISGNFANQPGVKLYKIKSSSLKNANFIEKSSFFLGIHNKMLSKKTAYKLADSFFSLI